jgi:hypothetical protein
MSKPVTVLVIACAIALAAVAGFVALADKRPKPQLPEALDAVVEPAPLDPTAATADAAPHSYSVPGSVAAPSQHASALPNAGKHLDEASLLTRLHDLAASDPPLSLKLAKEAVDRFPDSPNAPEFQWNVVKALFNMGQLEEAKDEARIMLWKYPDNYYTGDVVHHLLNPPPNPSDVAVQGQ